MTWSASRLAGARKLVDVYYYNVPPPANRTPEARTSQRQFYARIQSQAGVTFRMGYLQSRRVAGTTLYEEKGVDVALVVDMLSGAFRDEYDSAILVSSDGDFKPAVEAVRHLGKRVEYLYFKTSTFSQALNQVCDISRACRRAWLAVF